MMEEHGWMTATSPDKTLLRDIQANPWPGAYIHHIAGTRTVRRYEDFPLQHAVFEACFGEEPRREDWERAGLSHDKEAQRELFREDNPAKDRIVRCGMHVIRSCSFHLNNQAATDTPAFCGELLCSMVAECFHYQVDNVGGDGNSSTYRFGGSNQKSSSNEQSLFQKSSDPLGMHSCHDKEAILKSVPN